MSSSKSLSANRPSSPSATTPHREIKRGSVGNLDALPSEINGASLDCLLPHEQVGFAHTGVLGLEFSNQSVAPLVPFPARVTQSRALEWTRRFQDLSPKMKKALEEMHGLLPCPNIFSDENAQSVHIETAEAYGHAIEGNATGMQVCIIEAEAYAKESGIKMPVTRNIERLGYAKAATVKLAEARELISEGRWDPETDHVIAKLLLDHAKKYAGLAGIQIPDADIAEIQQMMSPSHQA